MQDVPVCRPKKKGSNMTHRISDADAAAFHAFNEKKRLSPTGIKCWDYCSMMYRYYCECTSPNATKMERFGACPECGTTHSEFRDASLT